MTSPTLRPLPTNLPELTSLRFVAAIMVMALHFTETWAPQTHEFGLIRLAYLGVDFFFILSGFILTHVYLQAFAEQRFNYLDFLWARLARIYPVHIFTTVLLFSIFAIATVLNFHAPTSVYPRMIAAEATMTTAWGVIDHWPLNRPSWSISAEWAAYLAFPLALIATRALQNRPLLFVAGAVAISLVMMPISQWAFGKPYTDLAYDFGAIRIFPSFLLGCALYTLATSRTHSRDLSLVLLVFSCVLALGLMHFWAPPLAIVFAFAGVIYAAAQIARHPGASGVLAGKRFVYLGEISFALYMVHRVVEDFFLRIVGVGLGWKPGLDMMAAATVVSLIAAAAIYHGVEKPMRDWMRAFPPSTWRTLLPMRRS